MLPTARRDGLVVKELATETLVYDLQSNRAHCLNGASARVWRECDGSTSVAAIAARLYPAIPGPDAEALVELALAQLARRNLLLESHSIAASQDRPARRAALRRLVAAAVCLPLALTVLAPKAHAASSCPAGLTSCSGGCKNLQTDVNNCGSCGNVCQLGGFLFAFCSSGNCMTTDVAPR